MTPAELVSNAEAAYASQSLDRVRALFDPGIVVWWNGRKTIEGIDALVAFEAKNFASWTDFTIKKTLRVADGDALAVEWDCTYVPKDSGKRRRVVGAEVWKMRDGRVAEWRGWSADYDS